MKFAAQQVKELVDPAIIEPTSPWALLTDYIILQEKKVQKPSCTTTLPTILAKVIRTFVHYSESVAL